MKKILSLILVIISSTSVFSSTNTIVVTMNKKGLFGYRYVDETHATYGSELNCSNPGFKGCAWKKQPSQFGYDLNNDDLSAIDKKVFEIITEEKTNGQFVYTDYLVVYNLENDTENLTYTIYNRDEAIAHGFNY